MRSVPLPFLSKITLLWTRAREPGPVSPVKVDSPLPFPWTQRGEIYIPPVLSTFNFVMIAGYGAVKIPPVYAFREIKAHENQVFPCIVGGQVGQTIQSLPKQASKCVENNP